MENILSFVNKSISGKQIKEWIQYHTENNTEYSRIAKTMNRYQNLCDDGMYYIVLNPAGTGCGEIKKYKPNVVRVKEDAQEEGYL